LTADPVGLWSVWGTLRKEAGRLVAEPAFETTNDGDVAVVKLLGEHDLAGQTSSRRRYRNRCLRANA
jgi:hypothetical protein